MLGPQPQSKTGTHVAVQFCRNEHKCRLRAFASVAARHPGQSNGARLRAPTRWSCSDRRGSVVPSQHMAVLTVTLDQDALDRLRETAERAGVPIEALAESVLASYLAQEPLEFVAIGASRELSAKSLDELLEAGFGR